MDRRKKILIVITKGGIGGAQRYVHDLRAYSDPKHFEIKIATGNEGQELRPDIIIPHLSNAIHPWLLFWNDCYAMYELVKIFQREEPDVIHVNSSKAGIIGSIAAAWCKIPCVFTVHGWVFNPTNNLSIWKRCVYIVLHWIAARFQNRIICVSAYDRELALRYHIKQQDEVIEIPIGIDNKTQKLLTKVTARENIAKLAELQGYKLNHEKPWVGSIGRLVTEKNFETLIAAMTHIDANLVIIGDGPERMNLKNKLKQYGLIERAALVTVMQGAAAYCNAFDIFVLPSIKEGLPYTLLEAMNAGLPIVVTNVGGMPEAIQHNENGFVVPPHNPRMLGTAIQTLFNDKKMSKIFGVAAKKEAKENYTLDTMIKKTESVYNALIAARKVSA